MRSGIYISAGTTWANASTAQASVIMAALRRFGTMPFELKADSAVLTADGTASTAPHVRLVDNIMGTPVFQYVDVASVHHILLVPPPGVTEQIHFLNTVFAADADDYVVL
jgi:hypothetical protein